MANDLIIGLSAGGGGIFVGGWFVRFLFQRYFDRANTDHDMLIKMDVKIERIEKDLNSLHQKIRELKEK